jgi:uncharacterized protein YdaU (DUF1376 family)
MKEHRLLQSLGRCFAKNSAEDHEQIAGVGDYLVALETYRAAVKRWPKDKITLRNRARVLEKSWRG